VTTIAGQPVKSSLTVRYTWLVPRWSTHPRYTYVEHEGEARALRYALGTLRAQAPDDTLRIVLAEIEIPGGGWSPVEPSAGEGRSPRKLIEVCADEVMPGDWIRDQGAFRTVTRVAAQVLAWSLRLEFAPLAGFSSGLSVPLFQVISVWRSCREAEPVDAGTAPDGQ
jgi:hypothetical protein